MNTNPVSRLDAYNRASAALNKAHAIANLLRTTGCDNAHTTMHAGWALVDLLDEAARMDARGKSP